MWSFFGKLFGTDAATAAIIENASAGLDKMFYTEEERADIMASDRSEARKMVIGWMRNTQGQNLARRLLALLIACVWLLQYVGALVLHVMVPWVSVTLAYKLDLSAAALSKNADQMNGAMMLLLGFYFAAPHMSSIVEVAMNKFSGAASPVAPKTVSAIKGEVK